MQKTAYLLDLGAVLIDIDYDRTRHAFEKLGIVQFDAIYNQFAQGEAFSRFECGQMSSMAFVNELLDHLPKGSSPNAVVDAWNAMIGHFPEEKVLLLEAMSASRALYLLSNTNALHLDLVRRRWAQVRDYPFEQLFKACYYSHEIGRRKPDEDTFIWVCGQMGFEPKQVHFIDDTLKHVHGAELAGLSVVHYKSQEDLRTYFS